MNELGLSEAIIQRQGQTHINIDLPGIQDIQRAKDIIGNTATLSFHMLPVMILLILHQVLISCLI